MRRIRQETLYRGQWRHLVATHIRHADGQAGVYEHVRAEGFVVHVVAATADELLLVAQPRPVVGADASLEVVAGGADPGEDGRAAAQRELREETGYRAQDLRLLREDLYANASLIDCRQEIWLATDLVEDPLPKDPGERIELVRWPLADYAKAMAQVRDAGSLLALLLARPLLTAPA